MAQKSGQRESQVVAEALHQEFCGCEEGKHASSYREGARAAIRALDEKRSTPYGYTPATPAHVNTMIGREGAHARCFLVPGVHDPSCQSWGESIHD